MFESTSSLCSRSPLSLQDAHLGAMDQAVNTFVNVSMVGPATQPREPATALLGSLGPTAALVRNQVAGLGSILLRKEAGPCWPAYGRIDPCPPASLTLESPVSDLS